MPLMLVGFTHVPDKESFNVTFRFQIGAATERFTCRLAENFSCKQTVTFTEFGHTCADYTNEWFPLQTIMPLYNAYTLMPTQNKNPHRILALESQSFPNNSI
jgi:hypothetical protein